MIEEQKIANKIAKEKIEQRDFSDIDGIIDGIKDDLLKLRKKFDKLSSLDKTQKKSVKEIKDLMDSAILPYFADLIEEWEKIG